MIDVAAFPLDATSKSSRPVWTGKTHASNFITRRMTSAIIRTQPALGAMAAGFCIASLIGLLALALLGTRGTM
jgi:hypothetical protein